MRRDLAAFSSSSITPLSTPRMTNKMSPSSINSLLPQHVTAKHIVGRTGKVSELFIIASLLSPHVVLRLLSFAFRRSISAMGPVLALPTFEPLSVMATLRDTMHAVSLVDMVALVRGSVVNLGFWGWILITGVMVRYSSPRLELVPLPYPSPLFENENQSNK